MASASLKKREEGAYDSTTEMQTLRIPESSRQRTDSLESDGLPPTETTPLVRLERRHLEKQGEKKRRRLSLE